MDLLENERQTQKNKKYKSIMIGIIILIILLIGVCITLLIMINDIQKNTLKLTIDGKNISKFSENLFSFENDEVYIAIKDFASLVGYQVYNGDRNHIEEDTTKCYIDNGFEQAAFELNSNKIYKSLNKTEQDNEYFEMDKPVKMENEKLYAKLEGIQIGTNCAIAYNQENNQMIVYTLPYLVDHYSKQYTNTALTEKNVDYSNEKALLYGMIVVENENKKYGVISTEGKEIIGTKYASIQFIESSQNFIIKTEQGKMGIVTNKGTTRIEANYDEIKQIDNDLHLYLATNNKKQGILNENGNIVVHLEYDKIGINADQYPSNGIKNQYLLFNKCIPVQRNGKWGIFDITGKQVVPVQYDELGCLRSSGSNSLLIIPEYEAIVVKLKDKYGLIDSQGKNLIPSVLDEIYSITNEGEDTYYMTQGENIFNIIDYLKTYVFKTQTETEQNSHTNTTNTTNEATNSDSHTDNETQEQNTNHEAQTSN